MATFLFIVGALCLFDANRFAHVATGAFLLICALVLSGAFNSIFGVCQ